MNNVNSSPFWDVYSTALKQRLAPGITLPKDNQIFALPFTAPFTLATSALTDEAVNSLLYSLGNSTLAGDNSRGKYADELNTYLKSVDESGLKDPSAKKEYDAAETDLKRAKLHLDDVEAKAKKEYSALPDPKAPFEQWVLTNYTHYGVVKSTYDSAKWTRDSAYNKYMGRLDAFHADQAKLDKALDSKNAQKQYNMPVISSGGDGTFMPKFSSYGLKNRLNEWITKGASGKEQVFCEVKVDSAEPPSSPKGGIFVKLTTKGVEKLDIHPGQWAIPDVKTLYPKQKPGAPKVLDTQYALPISFIIAYAPKLEVEIRGSNQAQSESLAVSDAKPYVTVLGVLGQHFPPN